MLRLGVPCKVDVGHGIDAAAPLKRGGRFCAHLLATCFALPLRPCAKYVQMRCECLRELRYRAWPLFLKRACGCARFTTRRKSSARAPSFVALSFAIFVGGA